MNDIDKLIGEMLTICFEKELMVDDVGAVLSKISDVFDLPNNDENDLIKEFIRKIGSTTGLSISHPSPLRTLYLILYDFFMRNFDINILRYKIPNMNEVRIGFSNFIFEHFNISSIKIPSDIKQKIVIDLTNSYGKGPQFDVIYDNSMTQITTLCKINAGSAIKSLNIYLPDNLSGSLKLDDIFRILPIGSYDCHANIYFRPTDIDGKLGTKFTVSEVDLPLMCRFLKPKS